jgi:hypothetical protein
VLIFGELAAMGRRIGQRLIDATHSGATGASGISREAARFTSETNHAIGDANQTVHDDVSNSKFATADSERRSPSELENRRHEESSPGSSKLTDRDREVIEDITRGESALHERINRGLWAGDLSPADMSFVREVKQAISKLRNYSGTVFRSITLSPAEIARYQQGHVVTELAFTSASRIRSPNFVGNVRFKIKSSTGKRVGRYSLKPHEKEVLFPPGARFEVTKVKYNNYMCRTEVSMKQV